MSKKKASNPSSADKNNQSLTLKVSSEEEEPRPKSKSETTVPDSGGPISNEPSIMTVNEVPVEEDGTKILATFRIEKTADAIGMATFRIPAAVYGQDGNTTNAFIDIIAPYIKEIPLAKIKKGRISMTNKKGFPSGDTFYVMSEKVARVFSGMLDDCGIFGSDQVNKELREFLEYLEPFKPRPNGYYEDLHEYWYAGEIYHEKDVIWLSPFDPRHCPKFGEPIYVDYDVNKLAGIEPCDVKDVYNKGIKIENGRKVLTNQEKFEVYGNKKMRKVYETPTTAMYVWWLASECAKTKDDIGIAIVCFEGKLYMPVFTFVNYNLIELESVLVLFNAVPCVPDHHLCVGLVRVDIGNMPTRTWIRPHKGTIIDWTRRRNQEVAAYRKLYNPEFDPYDDPYDDPTCGWMYDDGKDDDGKKGNKPDDDDDDSSTN